MRKYIKLDIFETEISLKAQTQAWIWKVWMTLVAAQECRRPGINLPWAFRLLMKPASLLTEQYNLV